MANDKDPDYKFVPKELKQEIHDRGFDEVDFVEDDFIPVYDRSVGQMAMTLRPIYFE